MSRRTAGRGRGFTTPQVEHLLSLVEQILSLGSAQWDDVHYAYNRNLPAEKPQRDSESLRRKFYALKNAKKPTGDPSCPPEIRRAKHVFREIEDKCSVLQLDDDEQETISSEPLATETQNLASDSCLAAAISGGGSMNPYFGIDAGEIGGNVEETFDEQEDGASAGSDASLSEPTAKPKSSTGQDLKASARTGKTPVELAQMSKTLKRQRDENVTMSHTAKTRLKIDGMLQQLTQPNTELPQMLFAMEERAHQRELQYRQEKEAREEKREAERLRAQEAREIRETERAERESQRHEMLMTMLAAVIGKK
ncbi:hypothetical protein PInf_002115 [Phytophthora infestans]|nr:hypothetical protein PInf_002115 [Phytophthora infestans]